MYEVDFLPVGDEGASGDAISMRFRTPSGADAVVVVDAGFKDDGEALVQHVPRYYGTRTVDLAMLTHPDADHIGGMGEVVENLNVRTLCLHKIGDRGGSSLPAAEAVGELIELAQSRGTSVVEGFAGSAGFEGCITILGPTEDWYEELVVAQVQEASLRASGRWRTKSYMKVVDRRAVINLPQEIPFGDEGGTNPRNNSSIVTLLHVDGRRVLFTGDAGVPALERAIDQFESSGVRWQVPDLVQIPHAGSRHNASSEFLNRLLGAPNQAESRFAVASVASKAKKHPSPRVVNAYKRRGCTTYETRGTLLWYGSPDAVQRGWGPASPLGPMDESVED